MKRILALTILFLSAACIYAQSCPSGTVPIKGGGTCATTAAGALGADAKLTNSALADTAIQTTINAVGGTSGIFYVPDSNGIVTNPNPLPQNGSVTIPANHPQSDTYNNPMSVPVVDLRSSAPDNTAMMAQSLLPMMDGVTSGNIYQLQFCTSQGACTIAFMGDSITACAVDAQENCWVEPFLIMLRQKFPGVTFTGYNLSLAGRGMGQAFSAAFISYPPPDAYGAGYYQAPGNQISPNWPTGSVNLPISSLTSTGGVATATVSSTATLANGEYLAVTGAADTTYNTNSVSITVTNGTHFTYAGTFTNSSTTGAYAGQSWQDAVRTTNPDAVFIALGINDCTTAYEGCPLGYENELSGLVNYFATWAKVPTTVLVANSTTTQYTRSGQNWARSFVANNQTADVTRGFAHWQNYPLIDVNRLQNFLMTGVDPTNISFNYEEGAWNWSNGGNSYWINPGSGAITGSGSNVNSSGLVNPQPGYSTLIFASGNNYPTLRARLAKDFVANLTFSGLTTSGTTSLPIIQYRTDTYTGGNIFGAGNYRIQAAYNTPTSVTVGLYYTNTTITSGACTASGATLNLYVRVQGIHHQIYCNGVLSIDVYDFNSTEAGYYGYGIGGAGGTISSIESYPGLPPTPVKNPASELAILGPYVTGSEAGISDYWSNPQSLGGSGVNHPSILAYSSIWLAAAQPLIQQLNSFVPGPGGHVATSWNIYDSAGNRTGISAAGGYFDLQSGPNGGQILSNNGANTLGQWDNSGTTFTWPSFIQSGAYRPVGDGTSAFSFTSADETKTIYKIDTTNNRFLFLGNPVLAPNSTDPSTPQVGELNYRSDLGRVGYYDYATTAWQRFAQLSDLGCTTKPTGTPSSSTYLRGDCSWAATPSGPIGANPSATATGTAVNGSATTFMRSDAAPAIQTASDSQPGLLASADWNTFYNKQSALGYTPANCTAGTSGSDCLRLSGGLVPVANLPASVLQYGGTLTCANLAFGSGAGSGPICNSVTGTDANHNINITLGTTPASTANQTIFTLTYTANRGHVPYPVIQTIYDSYGVPLAWFQGGQSATNYIVTSANVVLTSGDIIVLQVVAP